MKRLWVITVSLILVVGLTAFSFAQQQGQMSKEQMPMAPMMGGGMMPMVGMMCPMMGMPMTGGMGGDPNMMGRMMEMQGEMMMKMGEGMMKQGKMMQKGMMK